MRRNENDVVDIFGWGNRQVWPLREFFSHKETMRATD